MQRSNVGNGKERMVSKVFNAIALIVIGMIVMMALKQWVY